MQRTRTFIQRLAPALVLLALGACAAPDAMVEQRLDEGTGVTISRARTPLLLVRDTPAYGAYARSFVQVGAFEVNRMGTRQYFLWMSTWNTDHVASAGEHRDGFDTVILFVDGEPVTLDVHGWTPEAIGASHPAYVRPFASSLEVYYRVTINQLAMMAQAEDLWLRTAGAQPREFQLWDDQRAARADLAEFVSRVQGD
jgi:hypothetical protein